MARPKTVSLHTAKTHLSKLVNEAAAGSEIIIAKAGKAKARLVPLEKKQSPRRPGGWEGLVWISDDFDDELPPAALAGLFGEDELA